MSNIYVPRNGKLRRIRDGVDINFPSSAPVTTIRFPGDPGSGKMYIGANNGSTTGTFAGYPVSWFDDRVYGASSTKAHGTVREYAQTLLIPSDDRTRLDSWTSEGRVPMYSLKTSPWSLTDISNGSANSQIDSNINFVKTLSGNVWMTFFHEPEDNFLANGPAGSTAAEYRTAFRYIINRFKSAGVINVAWISPFFMCPWTFVSASGRDWRNWHPNWNGSSWAYDLIDIDGVDLYNPDVSISATDRNKSWTTAAAEFLNKRASDGAKALPWCIGEFGVSTYYDTLNDNGTTATQIFSDMVNIGAATQNLVGVAAWNSDEFRYDDTNDPTGEKVAGWKAISNHTRVVGVTR